MEGGRHFVHGYVILLMVITFSTNFSSERAQRTFVHAPGVIYVNETLVRSGFLGVSPERPSVAISLEVLETYRQLRRVCPRLSLDAFSRALCHLHHVCSF